MAHWVTDMSAGFTVDGYIVKHVMPNNSRESKLSNAMWQEGDGVSSGQHYWKIHFTTLEGVGGVGFTSMDHFKPSYECKFIGYMGGDLYNGGGKGRLVNGFGPGLKEGDVIGILAVFEDARLKMYIEINGDSLGLAYDVPASTFRSIFPMVSFHNLGSATCTKQDEIPNITERATPTLTGVEGNWNLTHLSDDDVEFQLVRRCTSKINRTAVDKVKWHVKVANTFQTTVRNLGGVLRANAIIWQKVCDDEEILKCEAVLRNLMVSVHAMKVDDDGNLSIVSDKVSSTWKRDDATPGPFVGDPFAGMD